MIPNGSGREQNHLEYCAAHRNNPRSKCHFQRADLIFIMMRGLLRNKNKNRAPFPSEEMIFISPYQVGFFLRSNRSVSVETDEKWYPGLEMVFGNWTPLLFHGSKQIWKFDTIAAGAKKVRRTNGGPIQISWNILDLRKPRSLQPQIVTNTTVAGNSIKLQYCTISHVHTNSKGRKVVITPLGEIIRKMTRGEMSELAY